MLHFGPSMLENGPKLDLGEHSAEALPRLRLSVDWYDIKIDNAIAAAGGGVASILDLCYNVLQDASHPVCQAINRDPSTGIISGS